MTVTPQTNATLEQIAEAIRQGGTFMVCGHVNPDGDCIGSTLAMVHLLESLGKRVTGLLADDALLDDSLSYMTGAEALVPASQELPPAEVFIAVDVPTHERMGNGARYHIAAAHTITLDHHAVDERISDLTYVDPSIAAAAMLVWELAKQLCDKIPQSVADCCYAGLLTDTGGFRFQNADYDAFAAAAQMVAGGADPAHAAQQAYQNMSLTSMRLSSLAVDRALFVNDGAGVVSWVTQDDMRRLGATKADAEPLVDTLRSIRGVRIACMLREQDGMVRGSLRAKDATDVSAIARKHDGGGHVAAAGFRMSVPIEEAVSTIFADFVAALR